jgi:hypothetical protein
LYLAESVAAVVEVKSNAAIQWEEVRRTATQLAPLRRTFEAAMVFGASPPKSIPLFVAGYKGWRTAETARKHLDENPDVAGILVIDPGIFVSRDLEATGPWALWGFISALHTITNALQSASTDPQSYA